MDSLYSSTQPYTIYEHHQWAEDSKPVFVGDEHESGLGDKSIEGAHHPTDPISNSDGRTTSMLKVEDEFSSSATPTATSSAQMWHERPHDGHHHPHPIRSFSTPHAPVINGSHQSFMRMHDSSFAAPLQHANTWSVPHSGASTPTPLYSQVYDMSYVHPAPGFSTYTHDPISAVSMSPQSSQGGWGSTASSDGTDQRGLISPTFRPPSPGTVLRPDGIRKKNARFEIPKERNLANIDAMILASTDENEKKELKQQKRLLRNRQAALDSRQRKKTHTEKLEQEKKVSEKKMFELEEAFARMENNLAVERDQFLQQRQHLENLIHALQYDRDEAIRTKTLETAELRRQIIMLKDCVRDLEERQQHKGYAPASHMKPYQSDFDAMGEFEDDWESEFSLINGDDLKMDDSEVLQRQTTPKPTAPAIKPIDPKAEPGFSWNTFCMCLLFGAFIASNSNNNNINNNAATAMASSIPSAEASNVIKTVLSSGAVPANALASNSEVKNGVASSRGLNNNHPAYPDSSMAPSHSLDHLHQSLSTPTRQQEMAATFSMSASSYQHLTDPFDEHLNVDDSHNFNEPAQPSALQKAYANMRAQKDNLDKLTGMGSKARERSLIWDQVPPEVIKSFEAMVQSTANSNSNSAERMEQQSS